MIRILAQREKNILIVALAMVVLAIIYNSVVRPLLVKNELLDEEIERLQAQWVQAKALAARARIIDEKFDFYLSQFGRAGAKEESVSSALSEIEKVARKTGVQLTDLKPMGVLKGGYDDQLSVRVTSSSEFLKIIRFLYELQLSPYFFNVEDFAFEKSFKNGAEPVNLHLTLTKAFIFPNDKQVYE